MGTSVLLQCAGRLNNQTTLTTSTSSTNSKSSSNNFNNKYVKQAPNIRWRGPDGQDLGIVGDTFRTQLANGSLYISSVDKNRGLTGAYQCLITVDGIGTIVSRSARVSIADNPEINQDSIELYLVPGQTAYFKCLSSPLPNGIQYKIQWLKDDFPLRFDATRMTLLQSGALEIDEVLPSDRGTYQCNITSGAFNKISTKLNLNIKLPSGLPESFQPPSFVTVPQSQTVREGSNLTLDCVANGNPKPLIKWLKNGEDIDLNDLDSRFQMVGTGSLQITFVQESDSGDYQCRSSNSVDSLDASATVQVQVPPKFTKTPVNKIAYEKEELEFSCGITGKPTPVVQWLKNGDLITPNDYMQIVGGHNLRILGLISSDAGMFQCVGTNPAGSIQASARLRIIEIVQTKRRQNHSKKGLYSKSKEKFPIFDPEKQIINQKRLLSKSVLDSLRSKDKNEFSKNAGLDPDTLLDASADDDYDETYETDDDDDDVGTVHKLGPGIDPKKLLHALTEGGGNLNNNQVMNFNAPFPTTIARHHSSNVNNVDNQGGSLAPLPGAPREVKAQIVKPRFVTLSWEEPHKNPDEVVSYFVYYKLSTSERERKLKTTSRDERELNIQSLLPGKTYQFRVVANSNHGIGDSSESLEVRTQPEENIAGPPQNVRAYPVSHTEINLEWQPPIITNGIISKYRIYYAEVDNGVEIYADSTDTRTTISELRPYTEYAISVVPWNQNGMGDSSNELVVRTYSSTPSEPPSNVSLETTGSTSILIRWEPPPIEERNGQITGYKIRYKKPKKQGGVETTPGNSRQFELKNLERTSAYQIKIAAMTINGTGPFTEWHHAETYESDLDESQVPGKPAFIVTRPSAESVSVSWAPPVRQEVKVRGYILGWGKGIPDEDMVTLDEKVRYYELKNLEPNSEYVISLRARNNQGDGIPVYDTVRTREEAPIELPTPLEVPVGLRAIPMSGTSIVLYWTDTTLNKNQQVSDNRHYTVKYMATGSSRIRYHNTTNLNTMISDLRPNTQYEFAVKVVKGRRESAWSMSVLNTTMQAAPVSPPRDLVIRPDEKDPSLVVLEWLPPKHSLGPITGYSVFYTTDTNKRDKDWIQEHVIGDKTMAVIRNLKSQFVYYFKVQTRNVKGVGPFSAMVSYEVMSPTKTATSGIGGIPMTAVYIIAGGVSLLVIVAIIITVVVCRKKTTESPEHLKKSYQKNNAGIIKPPDLWIHHDQMELKNMEKNPQTILPTPGSDVVPNSGSMTLPRNSHHEYDSTSTLSHITNSLDKRNYVPGYMGTSLVNTPMERPTYPRSQYSLQRPPHVSMDQNMMQQSQMGTISQQSNDNHYNYDTLPPNYTNPNLTYAPGLAIDAPNRGHSLKSFVMAGQPGGTPINTGQKQNLPVVTIRPQNSSPYKKAATMSSTTITNRLQAGPIVTHSSDEIQRLHASNSTEELNQEMANLEGLMKDLSAITASEFEC
uniref:CSON008464 protein n=1 Tax=Culicoides sonorensis TaxID=179676 RepID=A0A336LNC3_CULSO